MGVTTRFCRHIGQSVEVIAYCKMRFHVLYIIVSCGLRIWWTLEERARLCSAMKAWDVTVLSLARWVSCPSGLRVSLVIASVLDCCNDIKFPTEIYPQTSASFGSSGEGSAACLSWCVSTLSSFGKPCSSLSSFLFASSFLLAFSAPDAKACSGRGRM